MSLWWLVLIVPATVVTTAGLTFYFIFKDFRIFR